MQEKFYHKGDNIFNFDSDSDESSLKEVPKYEINTQSELPNEGPFEWTSPPSTPTQSTQVQGDSSIRDFSSNLRHITQAQDVIEQPNAKKAKVSTQEKKAKIVDQILELALTHPVEAINFVKDYQPSKRRLNTMKKTLANQQVKKIR